MSSLPWNGEQLRFPQALRFEVWRAVLGWAPQPPRLEIRGHERARTVIYILVRPAAGCAGQAQEADNGDHEVAAVMQH